jgi:hypothetical protein
MSGPATRIEQLLHQCRIELTSHVTAVARVRAAELRLTAATRMLEQLRSSQRAVAAIRDAAIVDLAEGGRSYAQLAELAELTRGRVAQVVQRSRLADIPAGGGRPGRSRTPNR